MEKHILKLYSAQLEGPLKNGIKEADVRGISLGGGQLVLLGSYGLMFWYGAKLVLAGETTFERMLRSILAVTMSSQGLGQNSSFLGDQAVAIAAATRLFSVVDRRPKIDSSSTEGATIKGEVQGKLEFRNITFAYPARPDAIIFKGFNLTVEAGKTVALVGASGMYDRIPIDGLKVPCVGTGWCPD